MIGAMIRFNRSGTSYNSYVFVLDRHDNGGGLGNGAYNGLNKVINQNMGASATGVLTKLSVNSSLRWTRNTWQRYKLVVKGNNLQAYIDDKLIVHLVSQLKSNLNEENTINKFNDSNIHYIGVGNETDKTEMETFIENIDNKGSFINIELEMSDILDSIAKYIRDMIQTEKKTF